MTALKSYRNKDSRRTTDNGKGQTVNGRRRTANYRLPTMNYELWTMNYHLWTIFLFLCASVLQAQPTGYQGKRMMFKTDLVSSFMERGINLGLEYVVHRNIVVGTDFSLTGKQYKQRIDSYYNTHKEQPDIKARIRDMQWSVSGQYFLNTALPAPKGSYVFSKYSIGVADIFWNDYVPDSMNSQGGEFIGFKMLNVPSHQVDLGLGYQDVFFGFLLIDIDFGLTGALLLLDTTHSEHRSLITDFAGKHGPNLYSLGSWYDEQPGGVGVSAHFKVGILLF